MNEAGGDSTVQVTSALMLSYHSVAAAQRACTFHQGCLQSCLPLLSVQVVTYRLHPDLSFARQHVAGCPEGGRAEHLGPSHPVL